LVGILSIKNGIWGNPKMKIVMLILKYVLEVYKFSIGNKKTWKERHYE
jgi:hypothetical protein